MAPRAIIYCAALSLMAAPHPSASRMPVEVETDRPSCNLPLHLEKRNPLPPSLWHFHCSEVVPPFHPSPLFFLFFFMCVCNCARTPRSVGRSVSLLCTRGRLRHLARSGASMKYVRTEGGSKNWPILWTTSTANMRTKGGGPKIQKSC